MIQTSNENNKFQVDIENLIKQNVNDLSSIKELYRKLQDMEDKILQIKYIDSNLANKLKKEYENLKKIILDENIQAKLTNDIETIDTKLTNDIETIDTKLTNDIETINSQMDTKASKNEVFSMANMGQDIKEAMTGGSVAVVGKNAIFSENIVNEQVTSVKTNFIESGKNKINKLMCEDGYLYYDSKKRVNNQYCITEKIKVLPNTKYSVRSKTPSTAYGDFITFWNNEDYLGVTYTNFINGGQTYKNSFNTPENCNCVIVSFLKTEKDTMQLEIGDYTSYEDYICYVNKYPINVIVNPIAVRDKTFKTIQEAVDYAVNGETIYIKSGTYKENVDCKSKYLNFIPLSLPYLSNDTLS